MLHQYYPQRARFAEIGGRAVMVGTVPVGTVTEYRGKRIIVEAWLPRECHAGRFDPRTRKWVSSFHGRGMFLAEACPGPDPGCGISRPENGFGCPIRI